MWIIKYMERGSGYWRICWDHMADSPRRFKYVGDARSYAALSFGPFPKTRPGALTAKNPYTVEVTRESQFDYRNVKCDSCMQWVSSCSCRQWWVS